VSYLFIAIVWVNHHHLFTHAEESTPRLVWLNFAHLFSVSLSPITTVLLFAAAAVLALKWPVAAMVVICVCLIAYRAA
jgi:uncharacterized membrane protein